MPEFTHPFPFVLVTLVAVAVLLVAFVVVQLVGDTRPPAGPRPAPYTLADDLEITQDIHVPVTPGRPGRDRRYRGRHHEDTIEVVPQAHRLPLNLADPVFAEFVATHPWPTGDGDDR